MVSRKRRLSRSPVWHEGFPLDWAQLQHSRRLGPLSSLGRDSPNNPFLATPCLCKILPSHLSPLNQNRRGRGEAGFSPRKCLVPGTARSSNRGAVTVLERLTKPWFRYWN